MVIRDFKSRVFRIFMGIKNERAVTVLFLYQWEALSEIISHVSVIINRHNF
jgi:hypothetical protein